MWKKKKLKYSCKKLINNLSTNCFGFLSLVLSNQFLLILFKAAEKYFNFYILNQTVFSSFRKGIGVGQPFVATNWVAGFAGVCSCYWFIFSLFGWHFARSIVGIVRLFMRYLTRSFIRCFRSFVSWPFIRSHGLCVHSLPSALSSPSCDC